MPVRYIPNQGEVRREMMREVGVREVREMFSCIPDDLYLTERMELPGPLSEAEVRRELDRISWRCPRPGVYASFLGGGSYRHHIPASVDHLISRAEFYTSYTPYQPEISQGTLQAIFEFQSMVASLTGLDVANASLYDGSTALAEAVLMADRASKKGSRVILGRAVHPEYREVVSTYLKHLPLEIVEVGWGEDGRTDAAELEAALGDDPDEVLCVALQQPNFFGCVEDLDALLGLIGERAPNALRVVSINEPYALGLLKGPGDQGADIVCGEMQAFASPANYGGPYLGFFATRQNLVRNLPGRIVGRTVDADGSDGYVLTLSTREQHIRREKATSNICTNEGLVALCATIHLCLLGPEGMREAARMSLDMAHHARDRVSGVQGVEPKFPAPFFNEFTLRSNREVEPLLWDLMEKEVLAGVPLGRWYPELADCWLMACTELTTREDVERLRAALEEVAS